MKNLCISCPIVWRLDQISGTVRPCNWSSPDMVPLSRPPVFVPNSTLVTCLLEEFWAGRWQSPPKAVLNLNLSDLLWRKLEIYIAERKTSQKNVEPRCKSDSKFTKLFPPKNIDKWQKLNALLSGCNLFLHHWGNGFGGHPCIRDCSRRRGVYLFRKPNFQLSHILA